MLKLKSLSKILLVLSTFLQTVAYADVANVATEMDDLGNAVSAWQDNSSGDYEIMVASRPTLGSWSSPPTQVSAGVAYSDSNPKIALTSLNEIAIVWYAYSPTTFTNALYITIWNSSTSTWTSPHQLSGNENVYNNYQVKLATSGDLVIVWNSYDFGSNQSVIKSVAGDYTTILSSGWGSATTTQIAP